MIELHAATGGKGKGNHDSGKGGDEMFHVRGNLRMLVGLGNEKDG